MGSRDLGPVVYQSALRLNYYRRLILYCERRGEFNILCVCVSIPPREAWFLPRYADNNGPLDLKNIVRQEVKVICMRVF